MLIDSDVSLSDAPSLADRIVTELRDRGLITGDLSQECVLGGSGYHIGPAAQELYKLSPNEGHFWTLIASGVEPSIERSCNLWALSPSCEYFVCPVCNTTHENLTGEIGDSIISAVGHWHEQNGDTEAHCTNCGKATQITEWQSKPPMGYGNLAFRFWNWPPFDASGWTLDIPQLFHDITGHTIVRS